jgi:hypothetical protein
MACSGCNNNCAARCSASTAASSGNSAAGIISRWGVGRYRSICPGGCLKLVGGVYRCSSLCAGCIYADRPYCPYNPTN